MTPLPEREQHEPMTFWIRRKSSAVLEEAIKQSTFVYATSARNRSINWPTVNPEKAADQITEQIAGDKEISIIFGREDRGLTNEELQLANTHIEIPANPEYPVLNIAMSVQMLLNKFF